VLRDHCRGSRSGSELEGHSRNRVMKAVPLDREAPDGVEASAVERGLPHSGKESVRPRHRYERDLHS
jgi:hypothetical protein